MERTLRAFIWLHWIGVVLLAAGIWRLWQSPEASVNHMILNAGLIGIGLLIMGPYPIAKFFQWAKRQDEKPSD